jgi:hypothetical protein
MSHQISELLGIVRDEIRTYRDLIEHARQKTALLVWGRVEAILESNRTDEAFNAKLRALELEMVRLCLDLGQTYGIPREEFTLVKLAENLEHTLALEIKSQSTLFRNLIKQLKSVNQRNMRLMERSVGYSGGILALISNAAGSYQPTGFFKPVSNLQPTFSQKA